MLLVPLRDDGGRSDPNGLTHGSKNDADRESGRERLVTP
jgi:hypothetical protein